jgi:hypothetical protein
MADKSQDIRLADVFLIGPFMFYSARFLPTPAMRLAMQGLAVATIVYNGRNYLINEGKI